MSWSQQQASVIIVFQLSWNKMAHAKHKPSAFQYADQQYLHGFINAVLEFLPFCVSLWESPLLPFQSFSNTFFCFFPEAHQWKCYCSSWVNTTQKSQWELPWILKRVSFGWTPINLLVSLSPDFKVMDCCLHGCSQKAKVKLGEGMAISLWERIFSLLAHIRHFIPSYNYFI